MSPGAKSQSVSWTVDCGSDFPTSVAQEIEAWNTHCVMRQTPARLTTRGWNGYGANEHRAFKYLTPKLRLDENSLAEEQVQSRSFHLICSPKRCVELVRGILARRNKVSPEATSRPLFIWEPVPDVCSPEEMRNCREALREVDYVSPNHQEMAGFFGETGMNGDNIDRQRVEQMAAEWLDSEATASATRSELKAIIVRCGKEGCYFASIYPVDEHGWMPAYHQGSSKVVDPTGGGNTFLGGLAIGLARGESVKSASAMGTVAASFAIEQVGMPKLVVDDRGRSHWNDMRAEDRLKDFTSRLPGM